MNTMRIRYLLTNKTKSTISEPEKLNFFKKYGKDKLWIFI